MCHSDQWRPTRSSSRGPSRSHNAFSPDRELQHHEMRGRSNTSRYESVDDFEERRYSTDHSWTNQRFLGADRRTNPSYFSREPFPRWSGLQHARDSHRGRYSAGQDSNGVEHGSDESSDRASYSSSIDSRGRAIQHCRTRRERSRSIGSPNQARARSQTRQAILQAPRVQNALLQEAARQGIQCSHSVGRNGEHVSRIRGTGPVMIVADQIRTPTSHQIWPPLAAPQPTHVSAKRRRTTRLPSLPMAVARAIRPHPATTTPPNFLHPPPTT